MSGGDPGVQPALSQEKWEAVRVNERPSPEEGEALLDDGDLFVEFATGNAAVHVPNRHALAALALYGQPFGFDHEDVKLLRETYDGCNESYPVGLSPDEEERFRSIIARIAALLPPEP